MACARLAFGRFGPTRFKSLQFIRGAHDSPVGGKREQRESVAVIGVFEVKHAGETGAGAIFFVPGSIRALSAHQIVDTVMQALAADIAACKQREYRPSSLGRRARIRHEAVFVVARAALAPAAIAVLISPHKFDRLLDAGLVFAHPGGSQTAQRKERTVKIIDAPATIPTAIVLPVL